MENFQNVYFDDLIVTHTTGPLLQEQSYYPFGLQMACISDKAINKLTSQNKFNGGVELEEDYGVNLYSTFYRQYDPQIGRFSGVDVLSESTMGLSTYQFGNNNPATYNDPSGAKFSPNNYGGHRPLFWGLTHSREIRAGLNMDDVEDMQNGWTSAFFNSGFGNGEGGGGGGGAPTGQGYYFSGAAAQNVFIAFRNAYNNSNSDGKWSFSVGMNNDGDVGYWQLNAISGAGASGETMAEIRLQREFISFGQQDFRPNGSPYTYLGGNVQNWSNDRGDRYAVFSSSRGVKTIFPGASITDFMTQEYTGYTTSNGSIHAPSSFDLAHLQHEYGHYLQSQNYGSFTYNSIIAPASLYSIIHDSENHKNFWTEQDANAWASNFFGPNSAIAKNPFLFPAFYSILIFTTYH